MITDLKKIKKILHSKNFFIFDFDGVIVDSVNIKGKAFYDLYIIYSEKIASMVLEHHKKNGGMSRYEKFEYYHKKFLNKKLDQEQKNELSNKFSKLIVDQVINCSEIIGAIDFLEKLYIDKKKCVLVSATPSNEINIIIKKRNLLKYFSEIYGSPTSKIDILNYSLGNNNIKIEDTVYFGDSLSDFVVANNFNIQFVGVGETIKQFLNKDDSKDCYIDNFNKLY